MVIVKLDAIEVVEVVEASILNKSIFCFHTTLVLSADLTLIGFTCERAPHSLKVRSEVKHSSPQFDDSVIC